MSLQDELSRIWSGWVVEEELGEGGFGTVYRIRKDSDLGSSLYAAVKVVEIPKSRSEVKSLMISGMDDASIQAHYDGVAKRFQREIDVMLALKGAPGVVAIEEQAAVRKDGGVGWTIYIRMELLTSLVDYQFSRRSADNPQGLLSQTEVVRLGEELSEALVACHEKGVIHRDIKPDNVFVTAYGNFKLGDFGIARQLESSSRLMSTLAGTGMYMAPEIFLAKDRYDATVDIYSLGLVLYQLVNGGLLPFVGEMDPSSALSRRVSGEPLPAPSGASSEFASVLLKACAYNPQDRYQNAADLLEALRLVERGEEPEAQEGVSKERVGGAAGGEARLSQGVDAPWVSAEVPGETRYVFGDRQGGAADAGVLDASLPDGRAEQVAGVPVDAVPASAARPVAANLPGSTSLTPEPPKLANPSLQPARMPKTGQAPNPERKTIPSRRMAIALAGSALLALAGYAMGSALVWGPAAPVSNVGKNYSGRGGTDDVGTDESASGAASSRAPLIAISAGGQVAGLRSDGTAVFNWSYDEAQSAISSWTDLVAISAGRGVVAGLRSDGTVVTYVSPYSYEYDVSSWSDIVAVSAGLDYFIVGLRADGSVVFEGEDYITRHFDVSGWSDIVSVSAGFSHIVGLRSDGSAVATGRNYHGECDVSSWTNLVAVAAGASHTVGLRSDGTAVALGRNDEGECNVSSWSDLVAVSAGGGDGSYTVGLRSDGKAVATGDNVFGCCEVSSWSDLVAISAGMNTTAGLRSDGTAVATGLEDYGVSDW